VKSSLKLLSCRIRELDETALRWQAPEGPPLSAHQLRILSWITHFTNVMSVYTDAFMDCEVDGSAVIDPAVADAMTASSRLLADIAEYEPSLTAGPLQHDHQHWTRTGKHALKIHNTPAPPDEADFVRPSAAPDQLAYVKPFGVGLYTSTATSAGCSMWRALFGPDESMMYPLPWYTWELQAKSNIRVAEITSAADWVAFVSTHLSIVGDSVYPDWVNIAEHFDAVHVTLPAIVAAQGFQFVTPEGVIPAAFWDVETTFWLRWCFSEARLVEKVR
jgi:hypothetical protein